MSTSTSQDLRCPRCDAHVRAGAQWCALCYVDLRPAPDVPEPAAEQAESVPEPAVDPTDPVGPAVTQPGRGKHARATGSEAPQGAKARESETSAADELVEQMLAQLAMEGTGVSLGRFAGALDSPGRKAGVMIVGSVVLAGGVFLIMTLVGVLL